jgi:hypothetical protein
VSAALSPDRVGRITGSAIAPLLEMGRYQTRAGLLREKVREYFGDRQEFTGSPQTQWGHDHEPQALADLADYLGEQLHSGGIFRIHPTRDFLGYTPDARIGDRGLAEVKAPWAAKYTHISQRPDYYEQTQLGMEVLDCDWCAFGVWRPGPTPAAGNHLSVSTILRDPDWLERRWDPMVAFIEEYRAIIADPVLAAPHRAPLVDQRTDEAWAEASMDYLDAIADANVSERVLEDARKILIKLAGNKSARGFGVSVHRGSRKGNVNWKEFRADHAPGADPDPYRAASKIVYTVRQLKAPTEKEEE